LKLSSRQIVSLSLIGIALIALIALMIFTRRKKHHQEEEITPEEPTLTPPTA